MTFRSAFLALLLLASATSSAFAGNTSFLTDAGTFVFPFSPPPRNPAGPGSIDNTTIGATTPQPGNFTTLTSTSGLSGPVAATTLSASGAVTGAGFTARFATPGPIGSTSPSTGAFTTLSATTAPTGAGFTALFASPPAIGGTAPAAGAFTTDSAASFKGTGTAPVPTGTGTPTIAAGSTNTAGEVTAGASATSIIITFNGAPLANPPFCTVTSQTGGIASFAYAITTSAITVTQSATSGNLIDYVCFQH
jgi:hypothetical protein